MSVNLPTRRLVSNESQSMVQKPRVVRSRFIGSKTRKTTFDAGYLIPFHVEEVMPGDHIKYKVMAYLRMATALFPIFDNMRIDTHWFFVPMRLVWSNFRQFMGQQATPSSSIAFTIPTVTSPAGGFAVNGIYDHFGLPTVGQVTAGQTVVVNCLPARAYNRIWNEWFRDQNQQNSITENTGNGPDLVNDCVLQRRNKMHDYFTTVLPWAQKFTAPSMQSTVTGIGPVIPSSGVVGPIGVQDAGGLLTSYTTGVTDASGFAMRTDALGVPQVYAEASINAFRQALLVQAMYERDARGGTRYTELIRSHFDVESPDARLQRPEYIGGGSSPLTLTPIPQTTGAGTNLGALAGVGTSAGEHSASYAATEHGYIMALISVRSELSYSQGLHRMWTRSTRLDFPWPDLAGLGEQAVLRQEIYCTGVDADDATVFGYQERYHEYRTMWSDITGLFRPTSAGDISQWHLGEEFGSPPVLGSTFIEEDPPMARILAAASTNQQFLADILIHRDATRPLPVFGTPASLGRF